MNEEEQVRSCMVPFCPNEGTFARGLCRRCYKKAAALVKTKDTTWHELEKNKKVLGKNTLRKLAGARQRMRNRMGKEKP